MTAEVNIQLLMLLYLRIVTLYLYFTATGPTPGRRVGGAAVRNIAQLLQQLANALTTPPTAVLPQPLSAQRSHLLQVCSAPLQAISHRRKTNPSSFQ